MKVKLKLQLKPGEVVALSKHLAASLVSQHIEVLRAEPADMLIMSALYELYSKVKTTSENIRLFPTRRTDEMYSVTITRTQALALACVVFDEPPSANALQSYESNFLRGLLGTIHQTFLI